MSLWQRLGNAAPYHASFLRSAAHGWLAVVTIGLGIAAASPLSVAVGVAAYGLGIIFLPDLPAFRRKYDAQRQQQLADRQKAETSGKERVRDNLLLKLTSPAQSRWRKFAALCAQLQGSLCEDSGQALLPDNSLEKVADSHLLLLAMDADIRAYQAGAESPDAIQQRMDALQADLDKLHQRTDLSEVEQRLVLSKQETLRNLKQQAEQNARMQLNLDLAQSELQRLESQISFLKAELITTPANQLSSRLGDTLVQVEASQRVLQEGGMVNAPDLNTLLGEKA